MVKNILAGLGVLFVLFMLAAGFLYERWKSLDTTSYEYAMDAASFVFVNWDFQELKNRADDRMFAHTSENGLKGIFATLSQLGTLQSVQGCEGQSAVTIGKGFFVTGSYACQLQFQKDKVTITLILNGNPDAILFGDSSKSWKILALNINSDYLVKSAK